MENNYYPFSTEEYSGASDQELVKQALKGSRDSLENLISRHQQYIYNVALKMVTVPQDAEDITQEVLIIVITKLSQFKGKSSFRTWLYRIVFNYFLTMKKRLLEELGFTFESVGLELDNIKDTEPSAENRLEKNMLVNEAKIGCMSAMLLCLDRKQRLVFILGGIFGVDHQTGALFLEISPDNYRQRLSRARKELRMFMENQCGLINKNNKCRCRKKTNGFIERGMVDPNTMRFHNEYSKRIRDVAKMKADQFCDAVDTQYAALFQDHPFQEKEVVNQMIHNILKDKKMINIFEL